MNALRRLTVVAILGSARVGAQDTARTAEQPDAIERFVDWEVARFGRADRVGFVATGGEIPADLHWLGRSTGRSVATAGGRAAWSRESRVLSTFSEISVVMVTHTPNDVVSQTVCAQIHPKLNFYDMRRSVYMDDCALQFANSYGVGLTPFGFAATAFRSSGARLVFEAAGGAVLFDKPTPCPASSVFNFTATAGASLELNRGPSSVIAIGYRFQHLSNAGLGSINPGIGAQTLVLSWDRRR